MNRKDNHSDSIDRISAMVTTLAHPDRLQILRILGRHGRLNVTSLQQQLRLNQAMLSHHLVKMSDRGILCRQQKGKEAYYSLTNPGLIRLFEIL